MVYVKVPAQKVAHIIKGQYPEDHTTCCGLIAVVQDKYLHKSYSGKVCEVCKKFAVENK